MRKITFITILLTSFLLNAQKKWTLEEAVEYAMKNNLQIVYNQQLYEYEYKNVQIAKNDYLPVVSSNFNNVLRLGQTQGFQGGIGRNDNYSNELSVSANLLIYNGGRLKKNVEKKQLDVEITKQTIEIVKNDIHLQILQQFLSINLNKELLKIRQSALENAEKILERAKITTTVGTTSRTVLAEAEATVSSEKQKLKQAEIDIKRSLFKLAQILQLKDYQYFDIEEEVLEEKIIPYSLNQTIEIALANHPTIKSAEFKIKSAGKQTEIVETAYLPMINFNAGVGSFYYNSLVTNITGIDAMGNYIKEATMFTQFKNNFFQQMGVSVSIPIFNKGNTKVQVAQSKINEDIVKQNLAIKKQELIENIQKVYFDMESHFQTMMSAIETEKSTALALDFAEKSYEAGKSSIYDLNIARNNFITAKSSVVQAQHNYIFNLKILEVYMRGEDL
ncbi:TolC family protein [Capnocytophaga sp. ARDL2]|uniref:TolC family protein n=1 Tax=Capnocytophaga sp. ARDL2 TaxID=3238809 RepID=UPI0035588358